MSKYFVKSRFVKDVKIIREYLEENGIVNCTDIQLDDFWSEFSCEKYCAGWMKIDNELLEEFADWLDNYEEVLI